MLYPNQALALEPFYRAVYLFLRLIRYNDDGANRAAAVTNPISSGGAIPKCSAAVMFSLSLSARTQSKENESATSKTKAKEKEKKTHCYYRDTNILKKSRYYPGKLVTLEEGEALVKQGN